MEKTSLTGDDLRFALLATDISLFAIRDNELFVRLIKVNQPFYSPNTWGLPGGLVHPLKTADQSAVQHIENKAGVDSKKIYLEQLYTFSDIARDPRNRVVSVAYIALTHWESLSERECADSKEVQWITVSKALKLKLAYDHNEILSAAFGRLKSRITYTTLISRLVANEFTLSELEQAYECIIEADLDKRNFRKKILKLGILKVLAGKKMNGRFRPAQLYAFKSMKISDIEVL
jgi:8-oxo-dGTP diphosphatase